MAIAIKHKDTDPKTQSESIPHQKGFVIPQFRKRVKTGELIFFTSQLALMLDIGTPLTNALKAAADQTTNPVFEKIIRAMLLDIQEGRQLSDAMGRHPHVFSGIFVSMVKAGETGGFLKKILDRMVTMQEKRQALVSQIRSTLTYPMVLCILSVAVVIFVLVGILPKFTVLFAGKESVLPFTTRFLMALSASFRGYWWAYVAAGVTGVVGIRFWKASEHGKALMDRFLVSMPLISKLSNKIYTSQFLTTLGHLMESQVPLIEALKVTQATFRNRFFKSFIDQVADHVKQGGRFARPFANYPFITESVKQMVATGEEVGNLPSVMLRLAEFYDNEIERDLKNIAAMLEPLALVIMGAVVGLIVSSVILPIFKMAHTIH